MLEGGMPLENVRHNIKLTVSGRQNEPRKAIAGCIWALLTHPQHLAEVAGIRRVPALDRAHRHVA